MSSISKGEDVAQQILNALLDRYERKPDRVNRISIAVPTVSLLAAERQDLFTRMEKARAAGGVDLVWGRYENKHNLERVTLLKATPIYDLLNRQPTEEKAANTRQRVLDALPDLLPELRQALDTTTAEWTLHRRPIRDISLDSTEEITLLFKVAQALMTRGRDSDIDIRTFSRRNAGNSKFLDGRIGKVADIMRLAVTTPEYLNSDEIFAFYGVKRYPQPCLVAGSVTYKGNALPAEPYVGVAPEMAPYLNVANQPKWLLTVENLASFNRQVREAGGGGIIIYTGGFPSEPTLAAILALAKATTCPVFHWGDIDHGGIKIAYRIEQALTRVGRKLRLHMMSPEHARRGERIASANVFRKFGEGESAVADLVAYMASQDARQLEQEELDPTIPDHGLEVMSMETRCPKSLK